MLSDPSGGGPGVGSTSTNTGIALTQEEEVGTGGSSESASLNGHLAYSFGGLFSLRGPQSPVPGGSSEPTSVPAGAVGWF